ncbi:hypothetical protein M3G01_11940, partial [Dietzia cinnamea]|nr:hypothetical protein [Dietzia cinnamea]
MTAAPAPPRELTIAVLGARDSAAPAVASALSAAAGTGLSAAAGPAADAGARIRVLVDAAPEDRPDAAVLVVDAVCPVRPDDVEVARGVAARLPMAVAVAGRARTCTAEHLSETVDVTTRRLVDAGVRCPVQVVDEGHPGAPAALLSSLLAAVRAGAVPTAPGGPVPRPPRPPP